MDISRIVFDVSALEKNLESLELGLQRPPNFINGSLSNLGFNLTVGPENLPAGLALDDGVIGWVVLLDERGTTTVETLKIDDNSVLGHGAGPFCRQH
jgi:hypothetical protein